MISINADVDLQRFMTMSPSASEGFSGSGTTLHPTSPEAWQEILGSLEMVFFVELACELGVDWITLAIQLGNKRVATLEVIRSLNGCEVGHA